MQDFTKDESMTVPPAPSESPALTNEQRTLSLCAYLIPLVTSSSFIAPLIIWLLKKGEDPYTEKHAKESLNFQITFFILVILAYISIFLVLGILLFPAVILAHLVFSIIACVKAYQGEDYSIPICIRFIK